MEHSTKGGHRVATRNDDHRHPGEAAWMPAAQREQRPSIPLGGIEELLEPRSVKGKDVITEKPEASRQIVERGVGDQTRWSHRKTLPGDCMGGKSSGEQHRCGSRPGRADLEAILRLHVEPSKL